MTDAVAINISKEAFMEQYADAFHEWVRGAVIKMSPVTEAHAAIQRYLDQLLSTYLVENPLGALRAQPFVMDLGDQIREPDLMVVLGENQRQLTETRLDGPADIAVEIVSKESVSRDCGDKCVDYERAGVQEYWIIDPLRHEATFRRHSSDGQYQLVTLDADTAYSTPLLPRLELNVMALWQRPMPAFFEVGLMVSSWFDS